MNSDILTQVALRYRAVYLDVDRSRIDMASAATVPVMAFARRLKENGYCMSEELLHALNAVSVNRLAEITACINDVMGVDLNWAPLVKGWDIPTGEGPADHIITLIANILGRDAGFTGTTLPCGHLIPDGTFPLERYNGCPFCGTPFVTAGFVYKGQASKLKELQLFTGHDLRNVFESLLTSVTPLDATQSDSLRLLLGEFELPEAAKIPMKETAMLVVKSLVEHGKADEASQLLATPTDILRYLWHEKTGQLQIIEPKTLVRHAGKMYRHMWGALDRSANASAEMKQKLLLKYDRKTCRQVARWINALPVAAQQAVEDMNAKRGMWVRVIRALRLAEYARKKGFEHLGEILNAFHGQDHITWQSRLNKAIADNDTQAALALLKQRPGMFARSLFSSMLRLGSDTVLAAFDDVADKLPARLLLSLDNAAETYFDKNEYRLARPITGVTHRIEHNRLLDLYSDDECMDMVKAIGSICQASMARRYAALPTRATTIYIDPALYDIPLSVGDRSATVQDASCALMGTRFAVEGDAVRLFLQWGKGLHAQHLDMDLSCRIALPHGEIAECAYYNLTCVGAKHSGDIRSIPEMVGTAEYIELSLPELEAAGARYATFTCNAYSAGSLSPNLVVGWMNSAHEMKVSEENGVAYDPSCVQHMVRISEGNLSKGLVFGVLDVARREIIWLEMPFTAQTLRGADSKNIEALLHRLRNKMTIGRLLDIKARAQQLVKVANADEADEAYTYRWALNAAEVSALLNV